jgi:hypothetical protein
MDTLPLKLILTPTLIGAASLAGRRWGSQVSGWLVGLPFTSGPVAYFVALDDGTAFATALSLGILAATFSEAVFCLGYVWFASRSRWQFSIVGSSLIFLCSTALLTYLPLSLAPIVFVAIASLLIAIRLIPKPLETAIQTLHLDWDIPARMIVATVFVLVLTSFATTLGGRLTGLLSPFPIYASVLTVFAHRQQGAPSAGRVLRGLLFGLFAFVGFFLVLATLLETTGIEISFIIAVSTALTIQAGTLWVLRRSRSPS